MITYFKNQDTAIKINNDTKSVFFLMKKENNFFLRTDFNNEAFCNEIAVIRVAEDRYEIATEEEFLIFKAEYDAHLLSLNF